MNKHCVLCGKEFVRNKRLSDKQWNSQHFCSRSCGAKHTVSKKLENPNFYDFLRKIATGIKQSEETKTKRGLYRKGKERWNWKGGISTDGGNYLRINLTKQRLHRKIMEDFLGRKLNSDEIVHHIDGNTFNNNISNLKIVTKEEHIRLHIPRLNREAHFV
jgi:hypothetical protein